jgi:hypothetical protein
MISISTCYVFRSSFGILSISCPYSPRWLRPRTSLPSHHCISQCAYEVAYADLVLSEKLVPADVLALIPETIEVRIVRKFPGNAEGAQSEMMDTAVEAARRDLTVVRVRPILHFFHTKINFLAFS